jgi:hypothetical protein
MFSKYFKILIVFALLFGCVTRQEEISENQNYSEPAQVTRSGVAISEGFGTVEVVGGDEQNLREFIQRRFTPMHYAGQQEEGETIITMGEIPDTFPENIPLPEGAKFIASVETPYDYQILLDIPSLSADNLSVYSVSLAEANWNPAPENIHGGGFVSASENLSVFCNDEAPAALTVQTFQSPKDQTSMRISLYTKDTDYMCDPQSFQSMNMEQEMIPTLETPAGAFVTSGGSSSGDGEAETSSNIKTELTPIELSANFSEQLKADGWLRLDGADTENFSWSSWKIKDSENEPWQGTLIIIDDPVESDLVFALMRVVKVSE